MNPINIYKEREKEFDEKFKGMRFRGNPKEALKSFNKQTIIKMLEAEVGWIERTKENTIGEIAHKVSNMTTSQRTRQNKKIKMRNATKSHIQSHLQSIIKELEK